ncbi:MAG: MCP four helix bundle domain-containing protein, partial [Spirochaetales bacterium]|nr:MCP four helix bundle domain-containing protein [Spirochaetales bacterium]
MFRWNSLKLGTSLFLGFSFTLLLTLLFGIYTLLQLQTLGQYSEDMHNHPMVVSNAVRDIKIDLLQIQNNLHQLIHNSQKVGGETRIVDTHARERQVEANFKLIQERFLGDRDDVDRAYTLYGEISPIFDDILVLIQQGEWEKAAELNDQLNRVLLDQLFTRVEIMSDFASGKSDEFYRNALAEGERSLNVTILFLSFLVVGSMIIAGNITVNITRRLNKLIDHVGRLAVGDLEE